MPRQILALLLMIIRKAAQMIRRKETLTRGLPQGSVIMTAEAVSGGTLLLTRIPMGSIHRKPTTATMDSSTP